MTEQPKIEPELLLLPLLLKEFVKDINFPCTDSPIPLF